MTSEATSRPSITPLSEMIFDTDIQIAIQSVVYAEKDEDFFTSTVGLVEEGLCPVTMERLTRSTLQAWQDRCLNPRATEEGRKNAPDRKVTIHPSRR